MAAFSVSVVSYWCRCCSLEECKQYLNVLFAWTQSFHYRRSLWTAEQLPLTCNFSVFVKQLHQMWLWVSWEIINLLQNTSYKFEFCWGEVKLKEACISIAAAVWKRKLKPLASYLCSGHQQYSVDHLTWYINENFNLSLLRH